MANATILTLKTALTAPLPNNPKLSVPGAVVFSDSFSRIGNLAGSNSDSYAGGLVKAWVGNGQQMTTLTSTINGVTGHADASAQTLMAIGVNIGLADYSTTFKLVLGPTNATFGYNALIDFKKDSETTGDCYRLAFYKPAGLGTNQVACKLCKRVSGTGQILNNTDIPVTLGTDTVRVDIKGAVVSVYVNDLIKVTYTDASPLSGTCSGFGSSSTSSTNSFSVGQYTVRGM